MIPSNSARDELPEGMVRPQATSMRGESLFHVSLSELAANLGISHDELLRWHQRGWLSFEPNPNQILNQFDDPIMNEIQIIRNVVRSGLTDAQIEVVLSTLPRPPAHNPDRLAYSFRYGWIFVPPPPQIPDSSEVIEQNLNEWIAGCDRLTLEDLRDQIDEVLENLPEDTPL
jgi:DNA-binding transcriptional MerR regulator